MLGFYQALDEVNPNGRNVAMTVLGEGALGEKALVSNGEVVWKSERMEEDACRCPEVGEVEGSGVYWLKGQQVFCEVLGREKKIVVCGGGHVSIPIIQMGRMLGCRVLVLEDRPKFADHARRAGANEVYCEPFGESLEKIEGDRDTFFVVVTRGHRYDQICLERIVKKEHAYIGMMGSRRRAAKVKEAVIEGGGNPDVVNGIYTPIGLEIGAETPEEIAVAVMAEIIQVKNRDRKGSYEREILDAILQKKEGETRVLATIVGRKGSAPRGLGTKMLVLPDGKCLGTIGGGCAEAGILQKALSMIRAGEQKAKLCRVDMTGEEAEEEGMVCGGVVNVLLESV